MKAKQFKKEMKRLMTLCRELEIKTISDYLKVSKPAKSQNNG